MTALALPRRSSDQAERLRGLIHRAASSPVQQAEPAPIARAARSSRSVAIVSGKGGVGKTSLAVNLAWTCAACGHETILIDADAGLSNTDILLGVSPPRSYDCSLGRGDVDRCLCMVGPHLRLLRCETSGREESGCSESQVAMLLAGCDGAAQSPDLIISDCAAGIGPLVMESALQADLVLLVLTPEPTAIADAYALIKGLHATGRFDPSRCVPVVNQCSGVQEALRAHERISGVALRFLGIALEDPCWIPRSEEVRSAIRDRAPFVSGAPRSGPARAVRALSERVLDRLGCVKPCRTERMAAGGFISRLVRRCRD